MLVLLRNLVLMVGVAGHFLLSGAALLGDVVIAPVVLSAPPASLGMFQGEYAYDSTPFWQPANIAVAVVILAAVALNWRTPRRVLLLIWVIGFVGITALSLVLVFPEYVEITGTPFSDTVDPELAQRGAHWQQLSWIRGSIFIAMGFLPMAALTRPGRAEAQGP